ncbi:MAG: hypothetical protein OXH00_16500 [Candidatus Poribacteria bacterium]|nr:hypothetical protein [Candidatus Poribacteria bacterium]
MVRNFFSTPNVIGRLMFILLFVGGVVYAGAFDGFVVETEASSCCCGGMDAESTDGCCGETDTQRILSNYSESNCSGCIDGDGDIESTSCSVCDNYKDCGISDQSGCPSGSNCDGSDSCYCSDWICGADDQCGGDCASGS